MGGFTSLQFPALDIRQPADPLAQVAQIEQVRGAAQAQEMGAVQLQEARTAQQSQATLMALYAKNNGDLNQTYADAAASGKVLPDQLLNFRTKSVAYQTQLASWHEKDLANLDKMHDLAANELEAVKALPLEQRVQGIKDSVGRILTANPDAAKWLIPIAQDLAQNPTDENINQKEIGFKGEQWLVDNELKQRQLASQPTVAQAQATTAANLDKLQTEALVAHQQLLSMPSPEEAAKSRWANLLKTQAEIAAARASTAKTTAETALLGTNPVIAFDPTTNQRVLSTMPQVQAKGFTNPVKASEADIQKDTDATKQFNDVQMNVSRYRNAVLALGSVGDELHSTEISHILSDEKYNAGHLGNMLPGASLAADIANQRSLAGDWGQLTEAEQDAVTGYLRAKGSIVAFQKALTQTGRTSKEALAIEMQNLPSPLQGRLALFLLLASTALGAERHYELLPPHVPAKKIIELIAPDPPQTTHTFPALDTNNAFTGNNTLPKINNVVLVDGNVYPLTSTGLQSALAAACNGTVPGMVALPAGASISLSTALAPPSNCRVDFNNATLTNGSLRMPPRLATAPSTLFRALFILIL